MHQNPIYLIARYTPVGVLLALVWGCFSVPVHAQSPQVEDLIAPIRAQVASEDEPFSILIFITLKPGEEGAFERTFAPVIAATRQEPGNIEFQLSQHPTESNVYFLYERWENLTAVEQHMGLPHMTEFWPVYLPMLARMPEFEIYMARELTASR